MKSAFDIQHGGSHYKQFKIQPMEYTLANGLGYCEGTAIKYLTRWKLKGGIQDLYKAKHFIELLIEYMERQNECDAEGEEDGQSRYIATLRDKGIVGDGRILHGHSAPDAEPPRASEVGLRYRDTLGLRNTGTI